MREGRPAIAVPARVARRLSGDDGVTRAGCHRVATPSAAPLHERAPDRTCGWTFPRSPHRRRVRAASHPTRKEPDDRESHDDDDDELRADYLDAVGVPVR